MSRMGKWLGALGIGVAVVLLVHACSGSGPGTDTDNDGLRDKVEDPNDNYIFDPGESDFFSPDTDVDGVCDGISDAQLACTGCEDCNNNGSWEPCLGETDPLNNDTDNDGIPDGSDPSPLDGLAVDCAQGNVALPYGDSLPPGKPYPVRPTPTPSPAPFPTSTPGPPPPTFTPAPG